MVWSATVIHSMFRDPGRKFTSLSPLAFERSIEAALGSTRNGRSVTTQVRNRERPTRKATHNIQTFKGIGAPHHQLHYPWKIFLAVPRERELSEVKTVRQVQQSARSVSHPSEYVKAERPSEWG